MNSKPMVFGSAVRLIVKLFFTLLLAGEQMHCSNLMVCLLWHCDRKERSLLLARDRYGVKPFTIVLNQAVFFGSEQKAIISQPGFKRVINKPALLEYFTFQNIFTDSTLLRDIHILPAVISLF